ncbi:hypothetical protein [Oceanospirillum sediminis]|uniref:Uncharacterized protein n=1 Tax=Oceanospirillum sediminis TaxID=2760088 RepID=A0A839IYA9_9GAMM|nr:hypothetical protein [Oceanospirillum sediminis]MBB1489066.1 hypothetical protein [Oceanospirillum sediminis]
MTIKPEPVTRDEEGWWTHTDLPNWGESATKEEIEQWGKEQDIIVWTAYFEDQVTQEQKDRWFTQGDVSVLKEWTPDIPEGHFLLSISDTEDHGPVALTALPLDVLEKQIAQTPPEQIENLPPSTLSIALQQEKDCLVDYYLEEDCPYKGFNYICLIALINGKLKEIECL